MPKLRAYQNTALFNYTPAEGVCQEQVHSDIKLHNPHMITLLGREAGNRVTDEIIPANKTIKLYFGEVKSSYTLALTLPHNDKILGTSHIIVPRGTTELSIIIQTLKAVSTSEVNTALLVALRD